MDSDFLDMLIRHVLIISKECKYNYVNEIETGVSSGSYFVQYILCTWGVFYRDVQKTNFICH